MAEPSLPYSYPSREPTPMEYTYYVEVNPSWPEGWFKRLAGTFNDEETAERELEIWLNDVYPRKWKKNDAGQYIHKSTVGSMYVLGRVFREPKTVCSLCKGKGLLYFEEIVKEGDRGWAVKASARCPKCGG